MSVLIEIEFAPRRPADGWCFKEQVNKEDVYFGKLSRSTIELGLGKQEDLFFAELVEKQDGINYDYACVYLLVGFDEEKRKPTVYVGQTHEFQRRIKNHSSRDWEYVLVILFKREGNAIRRNKENREYLEMVFHKKLEEQGQAGVLLDMTERTSTKIPETADRRRMFNEFYGHFRKAVDLAGFPMFDDLSEQPKWLQSPVPAAKQPRAAGPRRHKVLLRENPGRPPAVGAEKQAGKCFRLSSGCCEALGELQDDGRMLLLRGSKINPLVTPSAPDHVRKNREKHIRLIGADHRLLKNILFESRNKAAGFITGRSTNANVAWVPTACRESQPREEEPKQAEIRLRLRGAATDARCVITREGRYRVLAGSHLKNWGSEHEKTKKVRAENADAVDRNGRLIRDITFGRSSTAARFILGTQSADGPGEWVTLEGKPLRDTL